MAEFKPKQAKNETVSAIFIIVFVSLLILSGFFLGFNLALYGLLMSLGALVAFAYPRSGVLSIVFLTFIFERFFSLQSIFIGRAEYKLYPLDIILGAVVVGTLFEILFRRIKPVIRKIDLLLISFIFFNVVYFLFSVLVLKSEVALAFSTFKNYAWYSVFYFLILWLFREKEQLTSLFRFAFAGAVGIIFFIGFGIINGHGLWSEYTPLSTEGVRLLAFPHGFYLSMALIALFVHLLFQEGKGKLWQYSLLLIWTFGIVGTMMRHLWIALFAVLVLLYSVVPKDKKSKISALLFRAFLILVLASVSFFYVAQIFPQSSINKLYYSTQNVLTQRVGSLVGARVSADDSFSWRTVVWKEALKDYATQPIFGIGFGKRIFIEIEKYRDIVEVRNIHNSPLILLVQMGLVGILTLGVLTLKQTKKLFQSDQKGWMGYLLLSLWFFYLIVFLFQPYLETNLLGIFFWIILGLIRNHTYENTGNK